MNSGLPGDLGAELGPKSVQEYIDETPVWRDGTVLRTTPMTGMQWRIWTLAAAGKFFRRAGRLYDRCRDAAHF
jgi:hypothetical protein